MEEVDDDGIPSWPGAKDFEGVPWHHKPSILWLLPIFFIYMIAFGGIIIPRINLVLTLVCREYMNERSMQDPNFTFAPVLLGAENPQCREDPNVQALATKFNLYLMLVGGILSAFSSPKLGELSDRFGRKTLLSVTSCGGLINEIITVLAAKYPGTIHYRWLLLGAVFDGVCGSFIAGMALTHSYAADCTPPLKRSIAFGYFHACLFGGVALGPLVAANIVKSTGQILTIFYIALGCHGFFLLFLILVVPESLTLKRQVAARERNQMEIASHGRPSLLSSLNVAKILEPLKILWPTGKGTSLQLRLNLILLSAVDTIIFGVAMSAITTVIYYAEFRFGWGDYETQILASVTNICKVASLVIILPILNYLVRTRRRNRIRRESGAAPIESNYGTDNLDLYIIRASLCFEMLGYTGFAIARVGGVFFTSAVTASLGGIGAPILQSALTKHVPHDRVGQLLGATGLLHALARVVCPTVFSLIYATTVGTALPQTIFIVVTATFFVGFVMSCFIRPHVYLEEPKDTVHHDEHNHDREEEDAERIADEEILGV